MKEMALSQETYDTVKKAQIDEETGAAIYGYLAGKQKDMKNRSVFSQMSSDEATHAGVWKNITGEDLKPNRGKVLLLKILTVIMGFTFVVKLMEKDETVGQKRYERLQAELPQAAKMMEDEHVHEKELCDMLDEERLHYVGAMVLGLNDGLVELTGAIAGVTFALANTRLVAMTGIITGISATLSMAASNYLAERAEGNSMALKSSAYTGAAYLVTVALLVLPYLLFPSNMYVAAFAVMIVTVLLIILFFNYYISVAKEEPFLRRFLEMAGISLSVAVISFVIGIVAKNVLGIDTL